MSIPTTACMVQTVFGFQPLHPSACTRWQVGGARVVRWLPLGRGVKLGDGASSNGHKAEVASHRHPPWDAVGQEHILRQTPLVFSLSHNPALGRTTDGASAYINSTPL